jgi:hypothetical protein
LGWMEFRKHFLNNRQQWARDLTLPSHSIWQTLRQDPKDESRAWWGTPLIPTREAEAGRFLSSRPAWSTEWVPGQPGLLRETLSWKNKTKQNKTKQTKWSNIVARKAFIKRLGTEINMETSFPNPGS